MVTQKPMFPRYIGFVYCLFATSQRYVPVESQNYISICKLIANVIS